MNQTHTYDFLANLLHLSSDSAITSLQDDISDASIKRSSSHESKFLFQITKEEIRLDSACPQHLLIHKERWTSKRHNFPSCNPMHWAHFLTFTIDSVTLFAANLPFPNVLFFKKKRKC